MYSCRAFNSGTFDCCCAGLPFSAHMLTLIVDAEWMKTFSLLFSPAFQWKVSTWFQMAFLSSIQPSVGGWNGILLCVDAMAMSSRLLTRCRVFRLARKHRGRLLFHSTVTRSKFPSFLRCHSWKSAGLEPLHIGFVLCCITRSRRIFLSSYLTRSVILLGPCSSLGLNHHHVHEPFYLSIMSIHNLSYTIRRWTAGSAGGGGMDNSPLFSPKTTRWNQANCR